MARLIGPDMGSRAVFLPGGRLAAGKTGVVFADAGGTSVANIAAYQPGSPGIPGSVITGGVVTVDSYGLLPLFWFPDGIDRVWVSVNGGPVVPIDADYNARLDALGGLAKATLRGNRAVWLGDSITSAQNNDTAPNHFGMSMPTYAHYSSKGRLLRVRNAGVPGNRAADMLARFDTDVTPHAPSLVIIMAGTNDWNDDSPTPLATYQANIQALVGKCRQVGAQPVLCTVPPNVLSAGRRQRTIIGNTWLRRYCAAEGIALLDAYNLLVDPATGDFLAAYGTPSNDKTHPLNAGYAALGNLAATTLAQQLPPVDVPLPGENADPNNLLPNGLHLTTTGSGSTLLPTGWSVQTSVHPAGVTGSLVTGDATIKGNWWKVTADGTASAINNEFLTISGIIPGHVYAHVGRFKATGLRNADSGSGSQVLIGVAFNSVLNNALYDFRAVSTISYDVADGVFYQEVTAPSDATSLLVRRQLLNTTAGAGTLQVAQHGVYDLTAMGLV